MKRALIVFLAAVMAVCFAACSHSNQKSESGESTQEQETNQSSKDAQKKSKLAALMDKMGSVKEYDMTLEISASGMDVTTRTVVKGSNVYSDIQSTAGNTTMLILDATTYLFDPASKTYMQIQLPDDITGQSGDLFDYDKANLPDITIGESSVDSKNYYSETIKEDGATVSYLFEGDDLKYILSSAEGTNSTAKVVSFKTGVSDASLFEIPPDYTKIDLAQ